LARKLKAKYSNRKKVVTPSRSRGLIIRHKAPPQLVASVSQEELQQEIELADTVESLKYEVDNIADLLLREQYQEALIQVGEDGDLEHLLELTRYVRGVVPLDEFLHGNTYLGIEENELYPGVVETLHALESEEYVECVMKGAIGGGKTTTANLGMARQIYKISCMRNPQQTFGIQQHSSIVFTIQSVRLSTAKQAVFDEMVPFLANSPYFKEIFPYDKRITSQLKFKHHNVTVMPVSSSNTGAISMNVIGGLLDEVNFMQRVQNSKNAVSDDGEFNQARELYLTLSKRRRSRFMHKGKLPGTLFLVSSSRYPDDFTEEKAKEALMCGGEDPEIFVFSKTLWDSKGRDRYSDKEFRVLVGNERTRSRILNDGEIITESDVTIVPVPEDFRREFEKDIDGSVRDFAGQTTLASRPFIHNRESIHDCMDLADAYAYQSVYPRDEIDLEIGVPSIAPERIRDDVKSMRVCHVDLALTRDSAGLAVGHIAGTKTIERTNPDTGQKTVETLPVIAYDLIMRINPPRDGEIDFAKIRQIIYDMRDNNGIPIKVVTTDGFQSTDFRQILAKKRFVTEYLSLDRTTQPYRTFRDALYDRRILLPRHQTLVKELTELEYVTHGSKEKVDHKPRGSKDVADAVCGVAMYLMTRRNTWSTQPTFKADAGMMLHGHRTGIGSVALDQMDESEWDERHGSGRKSVKSRRSVARLSPKRKNVS
jgi:hypothetical protein